MKKDKKQELTEEQLVKKYVNRTIKNELYHGRVSKEKFSNLEHTHNVSKNTWMDTDFFFSVVFQSAEQKYAFIDYLTNKLNIQIDQTEQVQIVNGLELSKSLGLTLPEIKTRDYPMANIDLLPFVLDNESI